MYPNNDKNDNTGERYNESMIFCFDKSDNDNDYDEICSQECGPCEDHRFLPIACIVFEVGWSVT